MVVNQAHPIIVKVSNQFRTMDVIQVWKDAAKDPIANAVVMVFLLVCLILVAVYIVSWFRNLAIGKGDEHISALAEIERLRGEGKISFIEYQRLKQAAAESLRGDLLLSSKGRTSKTEVKTLRQAQLLSPKPEQSSREEPDFTETDNSEN